ncbi:MAG: hypothetical protein HY711_07465, partial [Candidatus Melainabacteria bacterium]|nr:hypothetical protein [Candidatus Melainabacteria bacterium]
MFLGAWFLSICFLQQGTTEQLHSMRLDPLLINSVPNAFHHFAAWTIVAGLLGWVFVVADQRSYRLVQQDSPVRQLLLYGLFGFFLYYLVLTRTLQFPVSCDESYIDYRYLYNWINGISFDYNPGEKVLGFTSHLHLLILTLVAVLTKATDLSVMSQMINVGFQMGTYLLLFVLLRRLMHSSYVGLMGAAIYSLFPYDVSEAVLGKETSLVSLLVVVSLWALASQRERLFAWCACLLFLARPEGIIWLALALVLSLTRNGLRSWKIWIAPMLLVGMIFLGLLAYFGTVIPHGFLAKSKAFYARPPLLATFLVLERLGKGSFVPELTFPIHSPWLLSLYDYFSLVGGAMTLVTLPMVAKSAPLRFYSLIVTTVAVVFCFTNASLFDWYFCWFSVVPCMLIPSVCRKLMVPTVRLKKTITMALCGYLLLVQLIQQPFRSHLGIPMFCFYWSDAEQRLLVYRRAAEHLNELNHSDGSTESSQKTAAVSELGVFGYYYHGRILDLGGLLSPEMFPYLPPPPSARCGGSLAAIPPAAIRALKPDYLTTDG